MTSRLLPLLLALLVARVLGLISIYFFEEDEVAIATGIAAMVKGTGGDLYRYTVQAGYYRLVEFLDLLMGGRVDLIPWIMKGLSAVAGTLIPAAGLFVFRETLTSRERWVTAFVLSINPIVWRSSQYGNTAIVSAALSTVGLVMLTNRPSASGRLIAVMLVGAATLVRADAVLLVPILAVLLYLIDRSLSSAVRWTAGFVVSLAAVYGLLALVDPRTDSAFGAVAVHMTVTDSRTMFWEFLLWALSPLPCLFAIWGFRTLLDSRAWMATVLLVWSVPTLLFYFRATTTPRYFVNVAVPLAIAGAIGMVELIGLLRRWSPKWWPQAAVFGLASLHLVVALGHTSPTAPLELFYGGTFQTDDGPMPTGAFLARTYLTPGSLLRQLPNPTFGVKDAPFWEGAAFNRAVAELQRQPHVRRVVIVLPPGGFVHGFHFHTHAAGARYQSKAGSGDLFWRGRTEMTLPNVAVTTLDRQGLLALKVLDVAADDLLWVLGDWPFREGGLPSKVPPGFVLQPTETFDSHFRTFRLVKTPTAAD